MQVLEKRQTGLLKDIGQEFIENSHDFEKLLNNVLNLFAYYYSIERGMIHIYHREDDEIVADVHYGYSEDEVKRGVYRPGEGITGTVVKTGKPIVIEDIKKEPRFLNRTGANRGDSNTTISFICVPILMNRDVTGTISVDIKNSDKRLLEEELNVLITISVMISQSVKSRLDIIENEKSLKIENDLLRKKLSGTNIQGKIIGKSRQIRDLYEKIMLVSETDTTVLVTGESGTGKELIADAIHYNSVRADGPFVKVNIAALPKNLIEAELFGYEKGAFTGADRMKKGRFELAKGGTIFLDEIGDLDLALQVHLLRVLQERTIERVGSAETIPVDVRVIAATHQNLEDKIKKNEFREDLYYRLNVFPIYSPPLRERKADIVLLADHFLESYSKRLNKRILRISTDAIDLLVNYHWPGNVRELENCIERAVIVCNDEVVRNYHLPPSLQMSSDKVISGGNLEDLTNLFQRELIIDNLKLANGNISRAAVQLGTTKRIISYKMEKLGIDYRDYRKKSR